MMTDTFDLAILGNGITGLFAALAAARRGLAVLVLDRSDGSPADFPLMQVTGQARGTNWTRALRSRQMMMALEADINLPPETIGLTAIARRTSALGVVEAFRGTEMGAVAQALSAAEVRKLFPSIQGRVAGGLFSPFERYYNGTKFIGHLRRYLTDAHGVQFKITRVRHIAEDHIATDDGDIKIRASMICPHGRFDQFPLERLRRQRLIHTLSLELVVEDQSMGPLPMPVVSDLTIGGSPGFGALAPAELLRDQLCRDQPGLNPQDFNLIVSAQGEGIHRLGLCRLPGLDLSAQQASAAEEFMLRDYEDLFGQRPGRILSRQLIHGVSGAKDDAVIERVAPNVLLVLALDNAGFSLAPALGEDAVAEIIKL
jgi:glycine/D-amino acid oxidase-like deaminating enzyme